MDMWILEASKMHWGMDRKNWKSHFLLKSNATKTDETIKNNEEIKYSFVIARHNEIEQVTKISMSIQGCEVSVNYMDDKLVSYTIHGDTYECPADSQISFGNTKPSSDDGFMNMIASILSDKPSLSNFHYLTSWLMGSGYLKSNVMFGKGFFPATGQFVSTFDKL